MDSLNYYKRFLNAGFMSMDPQTGAIKAWVGGINHKYFKYDHVRQVLANLGRPLSHLYTAPRWRLDITRV
jgi:penicillin-binding protein 1A